MQHYKGLASNAPVALYINFSEANSQLPIYKVIYHASKWLSIRHPSSLQFDHRTGNLRGWHRYLKRQTHFLFSVIYLPISIPSSSCKLLERTIAATITRFLGGNGTLSPCQRGFCNGLSTVTQLSTVVHFFESALDNKPGQVDALFLRFY